MVKNYVDYIKSITADVAACLERMSCQPILFIGSGLSKRYFGGPNWEQLLQLLANDCPAIKEVAYYKQSGKDLIDIGSIFADRYKEWAWSNGRSAFPEELFQASKPADVYIKYKICEYFKKVTPDSLDAVTDGNLRDEIDRLIGIRPHSVITTNYDSFLEVLFPEYEPIVGQQILRTNHASIGEIFKIHGCASDCESLVFTRSDYDIFDIKKKYLSAKLLAYFAEHPLLFIGYRAEDPNIKSILSDIDEILSADGQLIPNIYILEWKESIEPNEVPAQEKLISIDNGKSIRIKSITASSFNWVFEAFSAHQAIQKINVKLLRALLAHTVKLVRSDIPRKTVEVDYQVLENAVKGNDELAKLYGITTLNDPAALNAAYPYSLTQVGEHLGYPGWHGASKLLDQIEQEKGVDIRASDNRYHLAIRQGKAQMRKWSVHAIELLEKLRDNQPYELHL